MTETIPLRACLAARLASARSRPVATTQRTGPMQAVTHTCLLLGALVGCACQSFIDYFLLNELLRNHDVFTGSTFMFKSREGKLAMGPLWDLDRSLGDVEFDDNWKSAGFLMPKRGWAKPLLRRESFVRRYRERWQELRQGPLATPAMLGMIDQAVVELGDAPLRNFEKWQVLGKYVKANRAPYSETFAEEIERVKSWLTRRADWIDAHIEQL